MAFQFLENLELVNEADIFCDNQSSFNLVNLCLSSDPSFYSSRCTCNRNLGILEVLFHGISNKNTNRLNN